MDKRKKTIVKDVIRQLHAGLGVEQAKERILREVGQLSSAEITGIEQSLIEEGVSPEEIKRFCNVHALLFETALAQNLAPEGSEAHPLGILRGENQEIRRILDGLKKALDQREFPTALAGARAAMKELEAVPRHYALKENAIFPFLEKHGFSGPSQVMWAKHDEVRDLLREASTGIASVKTGAELSLLRGSAIDRLVQEVEGMIFKEENILFPAAREKLEPEEWVRVLESIRQIGPAWGAPLPVPAGLDELAQVRREAAEAEGGTIDLGTGKLSPEEVGAILNSLPVDVSFVDSEDKVRYFNQSGERIFPRSISVIGRSVQNCHPPQSVHKVNAILESFRKKERESADFWITLGGKFVSIRYFAVRGAGGRYLGCLEVTQDLTSLRALEGERRLLDDGKENSRG